MPDSVPIVAASEITNCSGTTGADRCIYLTEHERPQWEILIVHCIHQLEDKTTFKCNSVSTFLKYRLPPPTIECLSVSPWKKQTSYFVSLKDVSLRLFQVPDKVHSIWKREGEKINRHQVFPVCPQGIWWSLQCLFSRLCFTGCCWIEMCQGGFHAAANRDVHTRPGGWGLIESNVWLPPPQASGAEKSTSAGLTSPPPPPLLYSEGFKSQRWLCLSLL